MPPVEYRNRKNIDDRQVGADQAEEKEERAVVSSRRLVGDIDDHYRAAERLGRNVSPDVDQLTIDGPHRVDRLAPTAANCLTEMRTSGNLRFTEFEVQVSIDQKAFPGREIVVFRVPFT